MAKLEIFNSQAKVQESATPRTSALALPMSLATQRGSAITSIAKSIAGIQKEMYAIEDQNNFNKVYPQIKLEMDKKYSVYKDSLDTDAPNKLLKDLEPTNFKKFLDGQSAPVQRLLKNEISKNAAILVPKLNGAVSTNNIEQFTLTVGDAFDTSIAQMLSKDQAEVAIGTIAFENLTNNKGYEKYIGAKEYKALVKQKKKIKNKLMLNTELNIDPKGVLENEKALIEAVGVEEAKEYLQKAKYALVSKRFNKDEENKLEELRDQRTQIGAFSEVLYRISNYQKNPDDEFSKNELPTGNELYQLFEDGIINEAMFIKASTFLVDKDQDGMTDDELYMAITTQLYSATTIQQLDDIKKSYILDNNVLRNMAMDDTADFNALIDKSKEDFASHKDFKFYSQLINSNIRNISNVNSRNAQAIAQFIATNEKFINQAYTKKVLNGVTPENAYLEVLEEQFHTSLIPTLDSLVFPEKQEDWTKALTDNSYFDQVASRVLEEYKNSNQTNTDAKIMMESLDQINFVRDVFAIRSEVAPPGEDPFLFATQKGVKINKLTKKKKKEFD
tara:strand:+ start:129 stop:1805 length:1677 start_codon:yes stop_codon:yes gene_type:complete